MADGDSTVTTFLREKCRGGFNAAGAPKQDKTLVVGSLSSTYNTGGFNVTPALFGLTTINHLQVTVTSVNAGTVQAAANFWTAVYLPATSLVIVSNDAHTEATDSQAVVATFLVVGDDSNAPELL